MTDRETAERETGALSVACPTCRSKVGESCLEYVGPTCQDARGMPHRARIAAARASSPPSPGLVDSRLTELARTDATVAATLKHHANGVPLVEALTACVLAIAEHNRAMYKLAIDVVMTQPPASIVIHGAPGLVEAARNLSMELEDWFGMDCESAPPAITETFNVLRAALDKEPTNG